MVNSTIGRLAKSKEVQAGSFSGKTGKDGILKYDGRSVCSLYSMSGHVVCTNKPLTR